MTYHNAEKYINSAPEEHAGKYSFVLMEYLCSLLEIPYKRIKYIRVAGSNGKTICSAMLSSVLTRSGYNICTLNMSPLSDIKENIRHNTSPLSVAEICETVSEISFAAQTAKRNIETARNTASEKGELPTEYSNIPQQLIEEDTPISLTRGEILFLCALMYYKKSNCSLFVLEGKHSNTDPSLFLRPPFAALICGAIPNGDRAQISKIKSYIRRGCDDIISAPQDSEAHKIIRDTCASVGCRLTTPIRSSLKIKQLSLTGTRFSYQNKDYRLSLCGRFQCINAITVIEAIKVLRRHGYKISDEAELLGMSDVKIRSRFEVLAVHPTIIADSTHRLEAVETVCESLFDFSEVTGRRVKLCLPTDKTLTEKYMEMLYSRGYTISELYTISQDPAIELSTEIKATAFSTPKTAVKQMLSSLERDEILLISGRNSFTDVIRLEVKRILDF